jgi:peroxiredoxin Q/BCP
MIFSVIFSLLFSFGLALNIGDKMPDVKAQTDTNQRTELALVTANPPYVLVYFYPRADTPGCTAQACSLRDSYEKLQKAGVMIFGVSTDSVEDQAKFKKKHRLPFTLLADTKEEIAKAFGVPVRMGFTSRQAFLFKEGKLVWKDDSASTAEQAQDVLKFLEAKK